MSLKKEIYSVRVSSNSRAPHVLFNFLEEAEKLAATNGDTPETLFIYYSFEDYVEDEREDIRKSALAKLTQEEREILGLV